MQQCGPRIEGAVTVDHANYGKVGHDPETGCGHHQEGQGLNWMGQPEGRRGRDPAHHEQQHHGVAQPD